MTQPSLRGRVVIKFPANVVAGHAIEITKVGQTYTFAVDEAALTAGAGGIPEAPIDGNQYGREDGTWTLITGGGGGGVEGTNPLLIDKDLSGEDATIIGTLAGVNRWRVVLGDVSPESTGEQGSDFRIDSYNDDGTFRNIPIHIDRDTSEVTITAGPAPHHAILSLNKLLTGQASALQGRTSGSLRWQLSLGDGVVESGANAGSDFRLNRYDDVGTFIDAPLLISRSTGRVLISGTPAPNTPILAINKLASGVASSIQGMTSGIVRWQMALGDGTVESGTVTGSDFRLQRYNNAGALIDVPLWIKRDTGQVTLTGTPAPNTPILAINKTVGGVASSIQGQTATSVRWQMALGDGTAESGANAGSDFRLQRYNDAGALIDVPVWIKRATGVVTLTGSPPSQTPILAINKTASGQAAGIQGQTATSPRWQLNLGDGDVEAGGNTGSNFRLHRHNDAGAFISSVFYIVRANSEAYFFASVYKPGGGPFADSSDTRIKNTLGNYTSGLAEILQLQPVRYTFKGNDVRFVDPSVPLTETPPGDPNPSSPHYQMALDAQEFVGLIAQDTEVIMPELVKLDTAKIDNIEVADYRTMDNTPLIYALLNSIKDLNALIAAFGTTSSPEFASVGLGRSASANAFAYIGSGTGSLTDNPVMGFKVKIDGTADKSPDGGQINVNIVDGTAVGPVRGLVSRVDVNDTTNDGDTVALWGDVFVWEASQRSVFGLNTYISIQAGSGYTGVGVGAEIACNNDEIVSHHGGALHLVINGTQTSRFGLLIGGSSGDHQAEHNILMSSTTPPETNAFYYGPMSADNTPSGTALFRVDAAGALFAGPKATFGWSLGAGADALSVQRSIEAAARLIVNTDGVIAIGNGTDAQDCFIGRSGVGLLTIGSGQSNGGNTVLNLGTAAGSGSHFIQMWEMTSAPGAAAVNAGRLYLKDVSGKTGLFIRFNTGAEQQIAIEPP